MGHSGSWYSSFHHSGGSSSLTSLERSLLITYVNQDSFCLIPLWSSISLYLITHFIFLQSSSPFYISFIKFHMESLMLLTVYLLKFKLESVSEYHLITSPDFGQATLLFYNWDSKMLHDLPKMQHLSSLRYFFLGGCDKSFFVFHGYKAIHNL